MAYCIRVGYESVNATELYRAFLSILFFIFYRQCRQLTNTAMLHNVILCDYYI